MSSIQIILPSIKQLYKRRREGETCPLTDKVCFFHLWNLSAENSKIERAQLGGRQGESREEGGGREKKKRPNYRDPLAS